MNLENSGRLRAPEANMFIGPSGRLQPIAPLAPRPA
jgi:hypothetical protein